MSNGETLADFDEDGHLHDCESAALASQSDAVPPCSCAGLLREVADALAGARQPPAPVSLMGGIRVDLREDGLLWLINAAVFHPRGFALGIEDVTGVLRLMGDGSEAWLFGEASHAEVDDRYRAVERLFARARRAVPPERTHDPRPVEQVLAEMREAASEANVALREAVEAACRGQHRPVQHRDHQPPWCDQCGRGNDGRTFGKPKRLVRE